MPRKARGNGGRPPKLTAEARKTILDAISAGSPEKYAAERAGISPSTLRRWKARGRQEKTGEFRSFCAALKKARADAIIRNVAIIQGAARDSWQAAAWYLERTCPEHFASSRHEIRDLQKQVATLLLQVAELARADRPPPSDRPDPPPPPPPPKRTGRKAD